MTMPRQKPGRSKQDYGTPRDFIAAVERMYGPLGLDLAATKDNAKAPRFITPEEDSLTVDWTARAGSELCWLNPPFSDIAPWVEKCAAESCRIAMLVPASIGSEWFASHVHKKAGVVGIRPRLTFEGCDDPYPKDCMLLLWRMVLPREMKNLRLWRWDKEEVAA